MTITNNIIHNLISLVNENQGSSLSLSAHGWVGARATSLFSAAHFAKQNTNSVGVPSEGEAEGGCGGNSASPEPKRSPAALLVQSRAQQKSFLFLLEEKIGRAQIRKSEENFFAGWRASASGGGAKRVSFAQNRFGLCHIIAPTPIFSLSDNQSDLLSDGRYRL